MQHSNEHKVSLTIIRHGQTAGNLEKRYIGATDEPLCDEGIHFLSRKSYPDAQLVFVSPMVRCRQSAELIYQGIETITVQALREMDFGQFEGKNYNELSNDSRYQEWIDQGGIGAFPMGETRDAFVKRTLEGIEEIIDILRQHSSVSNAAIVAHGGTIMSMLSAKLGGDYFDYQLPNGGYYKLSVLITDTDWNITEVEKGE